MKTKNTIHKINIIFLSLIAYSNIVVAEISEVNLETVKIVKLNQDVIYSYPEEIVNPDFKYIMYTNLDYSYINPIPNRSLQCFLRQSLLINHGNNEIASEISFTKNSFFSILNFFLYNSATSVFTLSTELKPNSETGNSLFIDCISLDKDALSLESLMKSGLISEVK